MHVRSVFGSVHNEYFTIPSRSSIYHSVEGPLTYVLNGELITEPRPLPMPPILPPLPPQPLPSHMSQASFVSALAMEEESSVEAEKTAEPGPVTRQPHVMACYQNYLAHFQVKAPQSVSPSLESPHQEKKLWNRLFFAFFSFFFGTIMARLKKMFFYRPHREMAQSG